MTDPTPPAPVTPQVSAILNDIQTITSSVATASADVASAGLWSAIMGFFTALPGLVSLAMSFMKWINAVSGNNPKAYIANLGKAFDQLAAAQTAQQQQAADQELAQDIGSLPS